jgi:hypothetical protein
VAQADQVGKLTGVVSGQFLEHVKPWPRIKQTAGLLTPHARSVVIAPWQHKLHRYPIDCWRILPDVMRALVEWEGLEVGETGISRG